MRGISDLFAITIFIGVSLIIGILFAMLLYSDYAIRMEVLELNKMISSERLNTVIRLIDVREGNFTLLTRRLDGKNTIAFFLYDGSNYINCSKVVSSIIGGELISWRVHSLREINILDSSTGLYEFPIYARSRNYPDRGEVVVCVLQLSGNTILNIELLKPLVRGYVNVSLSAENGYWKLYGTLKFKLLDEALISVCGDTVRLPQGIIIEVKVNTVNGFINLSSNYINGLDVDAEAIYVNNYLIWSKCRISLFETSASILYISLTSEIQLTETGEARILYDSVEHVFKGKGYLRITGWTLRENDHLAISLGNATINALGIAYAIYAGTSGTLQLVMFTVTYISNKPFLVDVYTYSVTP